ncbi:unnamed protein product [Schistocephalus solidus]|uniref:Uncharacterized protein n=1 Tax=Schistocephalus solidus TaxID=70667 RepID=A0A183T1S8_SCHSO|nr:unnamed protein product [Schistocephalus solidus]
MRSRDSHATAAAGAGSGSNGSVGDDRLCQGHRCWTGVAGVLLWSPAAAVFFPVPQARVQGLYRFSLPFNHPLSILGLYCFESPKGPNRRASGLFDERGLPLAMQTVLVLSLGSEKTGRFHFLAGRDARQLHSVADVQVEYSGVIYSRSLDVHIYCTVFN